MPGGKCTHRDPYAGFEGAFRCLLEAGEIAFLKHTTVTEMIQSKEFSKCPHHVKIKSANEPRVEKSGKKINFLFLSRFNFQKL